MATIEQEVFDKIIEDLKQTHESALAQTVKMAHMGLDSARVQHEEKVQELNKQNDGLLGAVGRLQGDKAKLEEKVKDLEAQMDVMKREYQMRSIEESHLHEEMAVKQKNEIFELKKTIDKLKAQKARK